MRDSSDVKVIGLDDGMFYPIHIIGLLSIFFSFCSSVVVLIMSFKLRDAKTFYSWPKNERFVVYIAIFEGSFNVVHTGDHMQMLLTKNNVQPPVLCEVYAFVIIALCFVKSALLIATAVDAFVLIRFHQTLDFGKKDWRLLFISIVPAILTSIVLCAFRQLGPTGAFCTIKEDLAGLLVSQVSFVSILGINAFFYVGTWYYIRKNARMIHDVIGSQAQTSRAHIRAAKMMTLFVSLFCIQWWALVVFTIWSLITIAPSEIYLSVVIFTNIGGLFNVIIFIMIQKAKRKVKVVAQVKGNTSRKMAKKIEPYPDSETVGMKNSSNIDSETTAIKNTATTDTDIATQKVASEVDSDTGILKYNMH